jgi:negative regulator of flagellin synthesis FlgM
MQVYGTSYLHGAQPIGPPHTARTHQPQPTQYASPSDELALSPEALLLDRVRDLPEIRADRVQQVRAQLAAGTYETGEKLNAALDRLLDEIA